METLLQQESSATSSSWDYDDDDNGSEVVILRTPALGVDNGDYFDPLNDPNRWTPQMSKPFGFDSVVQARFQKAVDRIVGLSHGGHSIIKLEWAPEVFEWRPYALGSNPTGYALPYWLALWDKDGSEVAVPRWVLHQRCEPEQYLPGWEDGRWVRLEGKMHDAKGDPPPDGIYTRFHCHTVHKDSCCLRAGNEHHCWGYYVEPNADLLEFIGKRAWEARNDKEVQPTTPVALLTNRQGDDQVRAKLMRQKLSPHNKVKFAPKFKRSPHIWVPEE